MSAPLSDPQALVKHVILGFFRKQAHSKRAMLGSVFNKITETTNINNLRQIQATYDPRQAPETLKLQLLIKAQKSLVVDSEGLARDSHMVSNNSTIGHVTTRSGLKTSAIVGLHELSRYPEPGEELIKLREREKALQLQITKSQQDSRKKVDSTMIAEHENIVSKIKETEEKIPTEKRRLIKSSYTTQFEALREMGDKLMIIAHFGDLLLNELPEDDQIPYSAQDKTAQIKGAASLIYQITIKPFTLLQSIILSLCLLHCIVAIQDSSAYLTEGSNDSQGSGNIGSSSDIHHSSTRPSSNYSSVNQVINNQPAMIPSSSSQPPKLPNDHRQALYREVVANQEYANAFRRFPHDQPTVAEVGAHVPTTTNGPAHGILGAHPQDQEQPFDPDQPPAYSPIPADLKP
ncbi:hypothetical protein KEM48_011184 [Puccinia striiformis f. sp. tritici PST-130]|nr:hypothetical protein KEM48_011184 [Puccinia striiformis f. sp. tritici PST-130]